MKSNNFTIALAGIVTMLLTASVAQPLAEKRVATMDAQSALAKNDRLFFIENKGQWHSDVLYLCRMGGLDVWITKYGVNYTFYKIEKNPNASANRETDFPKGKFDNEELENRILLGHRVLFELQNANPNPSTENRKKQQGYYNYLIGNDPSKHATYVGLYKEVVVKDVYKGIDIRYYFDRGFMRYDFVVHPGADPSQISFKLRGQYKDYVKEGALCYTTRFGEVQMAELKSIQDGKAIGSNFIKNGDIWNIQLSHYDKTKMLIIDPLIYSTYIGGSSYDYGTSINVDGSGNAYVTGYTKSTDYDTTSGAFQVTKSGYYDVFVSKLNTTGSALFYSTYIGGSADDESTSIVVDGSGNAYITGWTVSTNYYVTPGAFQITYEGNTDLFVSKLNANGNSLIYSTYLGGSYDDVGLSIAIDGSGNTYITGYTHSTDYDITSNVFQTTHEGYADVFISKLNTTGNILIYSTYIGGSYAEVGYSIAVDSSGNAYITGYTSSMDYDVTPSAFQTTMGGGAVDVFVSKLNAIGTVLIYSTYIGGSDADYGYSIATDGSGNAYITGYTSSMDYDVTPSAFKTTYSGGMTDVFVSKFNATGSTLLYSTYIGGSNDDRGYCVAIDGIGNAYITGYTSSMDYNVTPVAFQTIKGGNEDVFVCKINVTGDTLIYSTYVGGSGSDVGYSIAIDGSGSAYITGMTVSMDYDITPGTFQTTVQGGWEVFVTKLDLLGIASVQANFNTNSNIHIYPNPNNGQFTIVTERGGMFELMDVMGKVLNVYEVKESKAIIQENLPAGFYFIREKNTGAVSKLVIE